MVLCRPASGSLRHPLNLTTSLFARMHFSFIQLQAPAVAYFPQQWHCCVPSISMGDQIGVVDSGPSVCSEPHKCESDVCAAAAVEVWQHMCCVRLLVSLCSAHLSLCVDLLCSTLWDWQTADVRGSHLPKNPAGNLVLPKKSMLLFRSRRAAVFAGARDGSGNVCTADRQTGGHCWTVEGTNSGGGKWRQGLFMFWLPLLGLLVICPSGKQIAEDFFKMLSWKGNITIG